MNAPGISPEKEQGRTVVGENVRHDQSGLLIERYCPARPAHTDRVRMAVVYVLLALSMAAFVVFGFSVAQLADMYGDTSLYGTAPAVSTGLWAVFSIMIHEVLLVIAVHIGGLFTSRSRVVCPDPKGMG